MNFRTISIISILFVTTSLLSGCATVLSGTTQSVTFESDPSGAEVRIDDRLIGVTPTNVTLQKGKTRTVSFSKEGYKTVEREIAQSFNGLAIVSTIFWDLGTTDAISGAMWYYNPDSFYVQLVDQDESEASLDRRESEQRMISIVLNHYPEFSQDLVRGEGQYLSALMAEATRAPFDVEIDLDSLRDLHARSTDAGDFTDRFLESVRTE